MISETDLMKPCSDYYKEALQWQQENYSSATTSAKRAWAVAVLLGAIALLLAIALAALTPLKEVELRVVEVDRITGETHVSNPIADSSLTRRESLKKYWVNKYVRARLTYDHHDMKENYITVRQLSDRAEFNRYHAVFNPKQEGSPYQRYGEHTGISVRIKAISFLDEDTASIRLDLQERGQTYTNPPRPAVATLTFHFSLAPDTEADRMINPLGFLVTQWRLDEEIAKQD